MQRKPGRPKKDKEHSRAPGISARLNEAESKTINDAIKRSGLKKSDWARKSLLYVAANDIRIT
jgi:hypothetical protein